MKRHPISPSSIIPGSPSKPIIAFSGSILPPLNYEQGRNKIVKGKRDEQATRDDRTRGNRVHDTGKHFRKRSHDRARSPKSKKITSRLDKKAQNRSHLSIPRSGDRTKRGKRRSRLGRSRKKIGQHLSLNMHPNTSESEDVTRLWLPIKSTSTPCPTWPAPIRTENSSDEDEDHPEWLRSNHSYDIQDNYAHDLGPIRSLSGLQGRRRYAALSENEESFKDLYQLRMKQLVKAFRKANPTSEEQEIHPTKVDESRLRVTNIESDPFETFPGSDEDPNDNHLEK